MALIGEVHAASSRSVVLVLTASASRTDLARVVELGAAGTLHKSAHIHHIIEAIRRIGAGETLFSAREIMETLRLAGQQRERAREAQVALEQLTPREPGVLRALTDGLTAKEIAQRLQIRADTARTHMRNILRKLGVESRLQAVVFAVRHSAVTIG
jgi:DNA-binding NarL/FixJ family response regulator